MNREQHLQWSKDRALKYVENNDTKNAFASFQSDMGKHDETRQHLALEMGTMLLIGGLLSTDDQMQQWIEGFN